MRQVETVQGLEFSTSPYITAYLAALLSFVESLEIPELGLEAVTPLFKGIAILGGKAERNQKLNDFLSNNFKGHLEAITDMLDFPLTLGDVEYHELNTALNEACGYLKLIPISLIGKSLKQTVIGNGNIVVGNIIGSNVVTGKYNIVGNMNNVNIGDMYF